MSLHLAKVNPPQVGPPCGLNDAGEGVGLGLGHGGGEDDHLVRGAVGEGELVADPAIEAFFRVGDLFEPDPAVPGDLGQPAVQPQSQRDGQDPDWVEQQHHWGHKHLHRSLFTLQCPLSELTVWQQERCSL